MSRHLESRDPATGALIATHPIPTPEALEALLARADSATRAYRETSMAARVTFLLRVAELLTQEAELHAKTMALEMGKPLAQGRAEVEKCAWVLRHYAEQAPSLLAPELIATEAKKSYVRLDPLGLVLAIMPWNFPFWQFFRCAAPALLVGDGLLLKHASNVGGCALAIESIFARAGLPSGLVTTLLVEPDAVPGLIADPRVAAVTLTGSERAGAEVAALAGRALKKTVLELGGSDAFIVLADADVKKAAEIAARARVINSGQSCIAAKRFILDAAIAPAFLGEMSACLARLKVGHPLEPGVEIGPLARPDLRDTLHRQVVESMKLGARLWTGGVIPEGPGAFYPPTLLSEVRAPMPVWAEETFGPVAAAQIVNGAEAAIAAANDSAYGLGAAIFSADLAKAEQLAARLDCGAVFINAMVKSDPRLPFGGVKRSGYGRELAWHGLRELANQKTVWVD
ncbi:MAG: NAD-dependent succinate-semialdehyde dehydrogenase [Myxococcota bacterium]